ncbi:MAG: hypothetical protein HOD60_00175 [Candidatus Nitrosopelagicus sp.]|nr:hypothetical protein [Candidatus Nitrosopelagicus sp.]
MGQRYIGAKSKIAHEILQEITQLVPTGGTIVDLMCGTGAISLELRKQNYKVTAVDVMSQACHITKVKILLSKPPLFLGFKKYMIKNNEKILSDISGYENIIHTLNNLKPIKGYFWKEFSPDGTPRNGSTPRKYFSAKNAQKIDAVRAFVQKLKKEKALSDVEYSLLVHDVIMSINDVANIAGTYGHYLSKFVTRTLEPIEFKLTQFENRGLFKGHKIINGHAEKLASSIKADLCYIDPPYKKRQYAANYHILETIAKGDEPIAEGQSGLRNWWDQYSDFCSKIKIYDAFEKIFREMKCDIFLISYSSEGLHSKEVMLEFFQKFGDVSVREFAQKRFKSRNEIAKETIVEYLFCLKAKPEIKLEKPIIVESEK